MRRIEEEAKAARPTIDQRITVADTHTSFSPVVQPFHRWFTLSAFVHQHGMLHPYLTPRETLRFHAAAR